MQSNWLLKDSYDYREGVARFYERVIEFNKVAGNDYTDPKINKLYKGLVQEEFKELLQAYKDGDPVEYCKELADCFVVTSYYMLCEDSHYIKDLGHAEYVCTGPVDTTDPWKFYDNDPFLYLMQLEKLGNALDVDFVGVLHAVMDSNFSKFISVHEAVTGYGGDLAPLCKKLEENSKGRYTGVTSQESNGYIVFRSDQGKIMKPPCYFEADIKKFIPQKWL